MRRRLSISLTLNLIIGLSLIVPSATLRSSQAEATVKRPLAVSNPTAPLAVGPGNSCQDNTLVNSATSGVLKVKACIGITSTGPVYSYSYWRCGKPSGQSGYQNCNLGIHNQGLVKCTNTDCEPGRLSILSDGVVGVQTKEWAGPAAANCTGASSYAYINSTYQGTNLASVRFSANPDVLYENRSYTSLLYEQDCGAAPS
jgi:hypothetical protein